MKLKANWLYIGTAIVAIGAAGWRLGIKPTGLPSSQSVDTDESARIQQEGFSSSQEELEVEQIADAPHVTKLTTRQETLLKDVLARKSHAAWWGILAASSLEGAPLQQEFVPAVRPFIHDHPTNSVVKNMLARWVRQDGRATVVELSQDSDPKVASCAKSALAVAKPSAPIAAKRLH